MLFPPRRLRRIFLGRACEILHRRGAVFAGIVLLPMLRGAEGFCFCCGGTLPPLLSKYFSCIVHPWKCYPLPCRCSHNVVVSMRGTTPCSAQSFWSAGTIIHPWKCCFLPAGFVGFSSVGHAKFCIAEALCLQGLSFCLCYGVQRGFVSVVGVPSLLFSQNISLALSTLGNATHSLAAARIMLSCP